ncbi:protein O-mannose kinase-like [Ornithodoros turicata]|uniref:protein O-mannose kinase-like n=1 Tax=Ornithodoros turicata TaxID=34597 RepID=UPI0031387350
MITFQVYKAEWNSYTVALSTLNDPRLEGDFQHNVAMHLELGEPHLTVDYLGSCENALVTEFFELGSAENLPTLWAGPLREYATVTQRLALCVSYVAILAHLHRNHRVMCDSNWLPKILSQYLLRSDLSLRVNDLDALPSASGAKVTCGREPLQGDLLAPEQRTGGGCDTQCDTWKVPDVCVWFLGKGRESDALKFRLFEIHRRCKATEPGQRPTAQLHGNSCI